MRRKQLSIRAKMTVFQNIPEVIACQNIQADLKVGFYQVYHFPKDPVLKHCQVVVAKGSGELFLSLLIFFSWTTRPNWTKLGSDTPWMDLYQNCVQCLMANKASDRLKMGNLWPSSSSKPLHKMKWNLNQEVLGWFIPFQAYVLWAEPTFQHDYCQQMMCVHLWRATTGSTEPIFLTYSKIDDNSRKYNS